jgi:hypothetical protein
MNHSNGNIISSKSYTYINTISKLLLVNSKGDAVYVLIDDPTTASILFKFNPYNLNSPISADSAQLFTGVPFGMVFGSTENEIIILADDKIIY